MPEKKNSDLDKIKAIPKEAPEDQKTNLSLVIISVLFLTTLGVIVYLYFTMTKGGPKLPSYPKKGIQTTIIPKEKGDEETTKNTASTLEAFTAYQDTGAEFKVRYPTSWGKVASDKKGRKLTFTFRSEPNFVITALSQIMGGETKLVTIEELSDPLVQQGYQRREVDVGNFIEGYRVSCSDSEHGFIQSGPTIYTLTYEYRLSKLGKTEAQARFDRIFDSFQLL